MKAIKGQFILLILSMFLSVTSCTFDNQETIAPTPNPTPTPSPNTPTYTIWSGPTITFTKDSETDPTVEANQDRITDNVWITRGNEGGQIYNAVSESSANKNSSPAGTQWAIGTTAEIDNLAFTDFRAAVDRPKNIIGQDLVLLLVEDSIAIDIKITAWVGGKRGGFTYERSTE